MTPIERLWASKTKTTSTGTVLRVFVTWDELSQTESRLDNDTEQYGTLPPFKPWEHDGTALVHVLWAAKHRGLNINDADEIAAMILRSRWLAARIAFAASETPGDNT